MMIPVMVSTAFGEAAAVVTAPSTLFLASIIAVLGAALAAVVILTALYAPEKYSVRAFRLLPWTDSPAGSANPQTRHK